ncbi:MAG: NAD(P)-binding domain-containing protein [Nitrospinota bacterium]
MGLGNMGFGMARALMGKGYSLIVLERSRRVPELAGQGAEMAIPSRGWPPVARW